MTPRHKSPEKPAAPDTVQGHLDRIRRRAQPAPRPTPTPAPDADRNEAEGETDVATDVESHFQRVRRTHAPINLQRGRSLS